MPCGLVHAQSNSSNSPSLVCDQPSYDFGETDNRKTVEHTFVVKNTGDKPVEITKLFSGCRCASATNSESIIAPYKEIGIAAKVVLQGRGGQQQKSFYVHYHVTQCLATPRTWLAPDLSGAFSRGSAECAGYSDSTTQGVLRLEMTGVAVPWIEIVPERVDFGNLEKDAKASREVSISWKLGLNYSVTNVQATLKCLTVSTNASQLGKITVVTVPPLQLGIMRGNVVALTDDPSCPKLEIPVIAMALCDIVVVPSELAVGAGTSGWTGSKYLALRSRSGKAFKILSIEPPDPAIKHISTPMGGQGYRIELPQSQLSSDIAGDELKIRTDLPGAEELVVPFTRER